MLNFANIPAHETKALHILPDVFFLPSPLPFSPAHAHHEEKYGWLPRLQLVMRMRIIISNNRLYASRCGTVRETTRYSATRQFFFTTYCGAFITPRVLHFSAFYLILALAYHVCTAILCIRGSRSSLDRKMWDKKHCPSSVRGIRSLVDPLYYCYLLFNVHILFLLIISFLHCILFISIYIPL